jgi:protein regulator of cytokinesis 1
VYPVRYEQLSAQEDKLNQLYSSKLDQLNTLTTRLSNLASTLGSSFYPDDILNPTPAPGELEGHTPGATNNPDTSVEDDEALYLRDLTPERFNRLEKELMRGKSEIQRRLVSLSALFEQIAWLYTELGILLPMASEPLPSTAEFPYPKPFQSKVGRRTDPFRVMPSPDPERQRREYMPLFAAYVSKLQEAVDEGREAGGVEGVDPTPTLIEWFEHLKSDVSYA